jgi:putative addiction module component (TIGR02574 family)
VLEYSNIIIFGRRQNELMDVQSTKYSIIEKVIRINDENVLNEIQAILEEEETLLTDWQKEELDRRSLRHDRGESMSFSWEEVKKRARSSK